MENGDGTAGKLEVSAAQRDVLLEKPRTGIDLDGRVSKPYPVDEDTIKRDFGAALSAQPPLPVSFLLYYKAGSTVLTEESQAMIPDILKAAGNYPASDVSVIGHTDTLGDSDNNEKLGLQRAQSVADMIRNTGLQVHNLTVTSHGEKNPLVLTPDNTDEPRNRRVEITIR